jgi:hypothetical protein
MRQRISFHIDFYVRQRGEKLTEEINRRKYDPEVAILNCQIFTDTPSNLPLSYEESGMDYPT